MFCTAWLSVTSLYRNTLHMGWSTTFIVVTSILFPRHRLPDWKHRWNVTLQRHKRLGRPYVAGVVLWHAPGFKFPNYAASVKQTPAIPHPHQKKKKTIMNFKIITNQLNTLIRQYTLLFLIIFPLSDFYSDQSTIQNNKVYLSPNMRT